MLVTENSTLVVGPFLIIVNIYNNRSKIEPNRSDLALSRITALNVYFPSTIVATVDLSKPFKTWITISLAASKSAMLNSV